jgi:serine/threonine-protein kinase
VPTAELRRNNVQTISDARRQFNADLALTGSVLKSATGLQVTLNLSDAASMRQKDSRILLVQSSDTADLQQKLAHELQELFGAAAFTGTNAGAPGETTHNSKAYDLYLRGDGALASRNLDGAAELLKKALELDPEFALARAKLAEAYLNKNFGTKDSRWLAMADAEVSRAAQSGSSPEVLFVEAMIRRSTGDTGRAIQLFRKVLEISPNHVDAYRGLAATLDASGRVKEAEETYQRAIRLRPGYWPTYNALAVFYMGKQEYAKAEQAFLTAISVAPQAEALQYNLGALYFNMSRWADAARAFERSLALKPSALAYANLGTVRFFEGNYPEAARQFQRATELQPANPVNWGNLGDALWQNADQRSRAREAFEKARLLASEQLGLNPSNARLRKSYALYLAKLGRYKEASAEIAQALALAPKDGNARFYAARVYAVMGDTVRAISAIRECLALGYSSKEIEQEPDLATLRKNPEFRRLESEHTKQ